MSFRAEYPGECADCEEPIEPGHLIERVLGGMPDEHLGYRHANCPRPEPTAPCPNCHLIHRGECF